MWEINTLGESERLGRKEKRNCKTIIENMLNWSRVHRMAETQIKRKRRDKQ